MYLILFIKPKITKLIQYSKKLKLKCSNGVDMNNKQAEIALEMLQKIYEKNSVAFNRSGPYS